MNIQSLSVVVPTGECWNHCPFCVSRMHNEDYGNSIFPINGFYEPQECYLNRMQFVRDEGCNSMIITGTAEPQQNMRFINSLLEWNRMLRTPFYNIALQTTGSGIKKGHLARMATLGLTTLSLSISSFDADRNAMIIGMPEKVRRSYYEVLSLAKELNLVTRASVNLTDEFKDLPPEFYFDWAKLNGFDQITFRKIYAEGLSEEYEWVAEHSFPDEMLERIAYYIRSNGTPILRLPYGLTKYSVHGISTVLDDDCMSKDSVDDLKYAILRPNGHLYSRWDDPGSLIF